MAGLQFADLRSRPMEFLDFTSVTLDGVPVAGVQKTTIRTFTVNREDKNEGLRPRISWT